MRERVNENEMRNSRLGQLEHLFARLLSPANCRESPASAFEAVAKDS
jgi:hypothetical protein